MTKDFSANLAACFLAAAMLLTAATATLAQNAAPKDRNAVNANTNASSMMADSPLTFPDKGPNPPKYEPDLTVEEMPVEQDYFLFASPARSLAQINKIQAEMPPGEFTLPPTDWKYLKSTRKKLRKGGDLHILGLGDSIINDIMRSGWIAKLREKYPNANIKATVYVRGGGGNRHYREAGRIQKYLVPLKPDLVFIGGISQQQDFEGMKDVIDQIRAELPEVEFLLATGAFGNVDPRDPAALAVAQHSGTSPYGKALREFAKNEKAAYLDMTTPWAEYIRSSGLHPHLFYRDRVHANEYGEQILSKIMLAFFKS
ncbi:SGNH/GDSL hydrolase family protein [Persicitalea sp.]|uniref:SGNH/GDSL hydrolase family protein n=1 Tax=Persicitalea sp. TaxID=3100273 RepID=UPI0035940C8F